MTEEIPDHFDLVPDDTDLAVALSSLDSVTSFHKKLTTASPLRPVGVWPNYFLPAVVAAVAEKHRELRKDHPKLGPELSVRIFRLRLPADPMARDWPWSLGLRVVYDGVPVLLSAVSAAKHVLKSKLVDEETKKRHLRAVFGQLGRDSSFVIRWAPETAASVIRLSSEWTGPFYLNEWKRPGIDTVGAYFARTPEELEVMTTPAFSKVEFVLSTLWFEYSDRHRSDAPDSFTLIPLNLV